MHVRSMNELFALERAPESYDSMMSGKDRFRCVLDDTAKVVDLTNTLCIEELFLTDLKPARIAPNILFCRKATNFFCLFAACAVHVLSTHKNYYSSSK